MKFSRLLLLVLATIALLPQIAQADVAGRYEKIEKDVRFDFEMTIEVSDEGFVRLQTLNSNQYFLFRDGIVYVVAVGRDETTVVKLEDMMTVQQEVLGRMGWKSPPDLPSPEKSRFAPMKEVIVGGRKGTSYGIVSGQRDKPVYGSVVISSDPSLAPIGDAIIKLNSSWGKNMGEMGALLKLMNDEMLALFLKGAPLRMSVIQLTDVSYDRIPPSRFALPAKPMTLDELRAYTLIPTIPPPPTLPQRRTKASVNN